MGPSLKVKCEATIDQAEEGQPPSAATPPGHTAHCTSHSPSYHHHVGGDYTFTQCEGSDLLHARVVCVRLVSLGSARIMYSLVTTA